MSDAATLPPDSDHGCASFVATTSELAFAARRADADEYLREVLGRDTRIPPQSDVSRFAALLA